MLTHRIVAYLISLAVGYWVLTLASKEKGSNQKIGKAIGWIIIVVSLAGPLCLAACHLYCHAGSCSGYGGGCPWSGPGATQCPMEKGGVMGKDGGVAGAPKGKDEKPQ